MGNTSNKRKDQIISLSHSLESDKYPAVENNMSENDITDVTTTYK